MYPVFSFEVLGSVSSISMYNLMIGIGIIIGIFVFEHACKKQGIPKIQSDRIMLVICVSIVFGFLSAALFDKFVHYHNLRDVLSHLFVFTGFTFAGGFLGGILAFIISYRVVMGNFKNIGLHINCVAPSVAVAHAFGRIGCFLGGCCFGRPTDSFIGVQFPAGSLACQVYGPDVKVIPTQLIESLFLVILFLVLYYLLQNHAFSYYLLFYGVFRFVIEFFRGDNRGTLFQTFLTPSQCLSVLMMLVGGGLLVKFWFFNTKHVPCIPSARHKCQNRVHK